MAKKLTGQRTYKVTVFLRRAYPMSEDITGDLSAEPYPEIDKVWDEVDKKVPASVPNFYIDEVYVLSAHQDLNDFAGNIKYRLQVTVTLDHD